MAPQPKPRNTEGTVELVVVADGLTYKVPGQKEPEPPKTYVTLPADRGDHIWVDDEDAERFLTLGSVAEPDSQEAAIAKAVQHRWGPPHGAVAMNLGQNSPVDKIGREAVELGLIRAQGNREGFDVVGTAGEDPGAVSGEPPEDIDLTNRDALAQLNVPQLRNLAAREKVELGGDDRKTDLVDKIHAHAKQSRK